MTIDRPASVNVDRSGPVSVDRRAPFNFTSTERRDYEAATLRYTAAAHIENYLDNASMPAKELARRIGKSRSWVSKLLNGRQNATLDTLAEVAWALGAKWSIDLVATNRRGTPAESDAPPPTWAVQQPSTASISVSISRISQISGAAIHSPIGTRISMSQVDVRFPHGAFTGFLQGALIGVSMVPDTTNYLPSLLPAFTTEIEPES